MEVLVASSCLALLYHRTTQRNQRWSQYNTLLTECRTEYKKIWSSLSDRHGVDLRWPLVVRYLRRRGITPTVPVPTPTPLSVRQRLHVLDLLLVLLRGHALNGLQMLPSTIAQAGNGLFTTRSFPRGALLCVYSGTSISLTQAMQRKKEGIHGDYVMGGFGMFWRVDAGPHPTVLARYINDHYQDATKQNAKFVKVKTHRIALVLATRDLEANEEIFAAYGEGYWRHRC